MTVDVAKLIERATAAGISIATAESCSGGMIAAALTDIPGSSAVVDCGFVTYSNSAKRDMLGVSEQTLADHGAVSEPVARQMAEGARKRGKVTLAVSVTGIAGPGGSEFKPEGRVCFGLAAPNAQTLVETVEFGAIGRDHVRQRSRDHALHLLDRAVLRIAAKANK